MSLCQYLPVAQAAVKLRVASKRLWRRVAHYIAAAREQEIMTDVRVIGIDETSLKRGQDCVTVIHDLEAKQGFVVEHVQKSDRRESKDTNAMHYLQH
ncbi:hypothetical protein [Actimicrobium sp. CCI2.3]|uniref:hypothetical protein n=1 Tax=Actimicrobium sp. CCI2.3 TaxID=3048616 RepID=UPI003A598B81